jgi:beta-N-acetylhexosaminidase
MQAIAGHIGTVAGAVGALGAGADVALISHDLELASAARDAIADAAGTKALPLARLREAALRVRSMRAWAAAAAQPADFSEDDLPAEIARRAIGGNVAAARLRGEIPVTVISFEGNASDGIAASAAERPSLSLALRRRRIKSELMRVPLEPSDEMIESLLDIVRAQGERQFVVLARRAHRFPAQRRTLAALFALAPQTIAVSVLEPFDLDCIAGARAALWTNGDEEIEIAALADLLAGSAPAA